MAEVQTLFYLHVTAYAYYCLRLVFLDDPLDEAGAGNDEETVSEILGKFPGLADAAQPATAAAD